MYASALRVVHPHLGERVNTFLHRHGAAFPWPSEAWGLPETEPGQLFSVGSDNVPAGGNRVRVYMDVLAPDGTNNDTINVALTGMWLELVADEATAELGVHIPNPAVYIREPVTIRFGVDPSLLPGRAVEFSELMQAVQAMLDVPEEPT